jgi:TonB family protein
MSSEYEGEGETTLYLLLDADRDVFLAVTNSNWSTKEGEAYDLSYILNGVEYGGGKSIGTKLAYRPGFLTKMEADFLTHFAAGRSLHIYRGESRVDQLSLSGSAAGIGVLRRCVASVKARLDAEAREKARFAHIPKDPFAAPPPTPEGDDATHARAKANLSSLISVEDYPASALRAGERGTVRFRLSVDPSGRVTDCTVLTSSGSSALDSTTCRLLRSRARFTPATDKNGKAIADSVESSVTWSLPST